MNKYEEFDKDYRKARKHLVKVLVLSLLVIITLAALSWYLLQSIGALFMAAKQDVLQSIKLRIDQETRIKTAVAEARQQFDKDLRASYALRGYIKQYRPALSNSLITENITLTYKYAKEFKLDPAYVFKIQRVECEFDQECAPGDAGERGGMQVTPEVFKEFMPVFGYTWDNFKDWRCTLRVGCAKLRELLDDNNQNPEYAAAQYNAGQKEGWRSRAADYIRKYKIVSKEVDAIIALSREATP
jgi:soluble lytic murein transglycosylase-like protein